MSRSIWKGPYVDNLIIQKLNGFKKTKPIYSKTRNSTIVSSFLDRTFYVYNGKIFFKIIITSDKLGFKLGSFCYTKKRCVYRKKKKTKKNK